jgi:hypothetical protein
MLYARVATSTASDACLRTPRGHESPRETLRECATWARRPTILAIGRRSDVHGPAIEISFKASPDLTL